MARCRAGAARFAKHVDDCRRHKERTGTRSLLEDLGRSRWPCKSRADEMCDAPSQHTCESRPSEPLVDGRSRSNWTAWSGTSASRSESLFLCLLDLCGVSMVVRRVVPLCVRLTRFRGERGQICVALLMHGRFVRVCCVLSIVSVRWREQKLQLVLF